MKVKIIRGKCWYKDSVGEVFEVTEHVPEFRENIWRNMNPKNPTDTGIFKRDCEEVKEMPKFNIGSKVIVRDGSDDDGRTGEIIERGTMYPWRIRYDSDGSTELFYEEDLELVEPQWMSKEAALKLCIDGAKVMSAEDGASTLHYMDFNGMHFEWHHGKHKGTVNTMPTRFKLWTPPTPPKPKFAVNDFVIASDDQAYMRITAVDDYNDGYTYECTGYADESGDVFIEEHRLIKV